MCVDMRVDMRVDMYVDMCIDTCVGIYVGMCVGMRMDIRVDRSIDVCIDMRAGMPKSDVAGERNRHTDVDFRDLCLRGGVAKRASAEFFFKYFFWSGACRRRTPTGCATGAFKKKDPDETHRPSNPSRRSAVPD